MKVKYYIFSIVLLLACVITGIAVRGSYTNLGNKTFDFACGMVSSSADSILSQNQIKSPNDLISGADAVLLGHFNGKRQITSDAYYSTVTVKRVLKGSKSVTGKEVLVIENIYTFPQTRYINGPAGYLPMQSGSDYILLLKKKTFSPYRHLTATEKAEYSIFTNSPFGKYNSTRRQANISSSNPQNTLASLKNLDYYTDNQRSLATYNQYRDTILAAYI